MGVVIFNGKASSDYGIEIETPPHYEIAERNIQSTSIPGRSGDLIIELDSYKNAPREYQISIGERDGDFVSLAARISDWLYASKGYCRLEDTYEPDCFFIASVVGGNTVANIMGQAGRAIVRFTRKPQRFLKSGEIEVGFTKEGVLYNPSLHPAKPLIRVTGTGAGRVNINDVSLDITDIGGVMLIDCDEKEAYADDNGKNDKIKSGHGFPTLTPGQNRISFSGGVKNVIITPRWWTL